MRFALIVYLQVNPHRVGALLIFTDIFKDKLFTGTRFLLRRVVRVRDKGFAPFVYRKGLKEAYDLLQFRRIHVSTLHRNRALAPDPDLILDLTTTWLDQNHAQEKNLCALFDRCADFVPPLRP